MTTATIAATHPTQPVRLLRLPEVLGMVGVSRATLYRMMQRGEFPAAVALTRTRSTVAWSSTAIADWIGSKLAANDGTYDGTNP